MDKAKSWVARYQIVLFAVCALTGWALQTTDLLGPLHEQGHWHVAVNIERTSATITDRTHTALSKPTKMNLLAGYETEITTVMIVFWVLLAVSSPARDGLRQYFFHLGLPLGYATACFLFVMSEHTVDFFMVPDWTSDMRTLFFFHPGLMVIIGWVVLFYSKIRLYLRWNR